MNNYSSLDLDKVKLDIAYYISIAEANDYLINEEVDFNPLVIENKLNLTKEAMKILQEGNIINFDGILSCYEILEKARRDIVLSPAEFNKILTFHNHVNRIKKQFNKFDDELIIKDYTDSLFTADDLFERVSNTIDNNGNIKSNASPLLNEIYNKILKLEKEINSKAITFINKNASSLQEAAIFVRNNRITFLIKNSDKNKFQGYSHGSSSSGLATYVEPGSFVELDNQKLELEEDKNSEEYRILSGLTYELANYVDNYLNDFESLIELCVIFAKANYGINHNGVIATINKEHNLILEDISHPLIPSDQVISNTYRLSNDYNGIVISGSNTGGKTVGLKTMGLSVIMSYLGIPLFAQNAQIPLYDNVFVDIDDNQSIANSLSTFSAHISNINSILSKTSNKSLVLIDELISGTDPKEAQAISLAIMDRLNEIGCKFIITTHFDDIKNYAYNDEKILLSSVGFDSHTLKPTYRYYENSVGMSNALEIASRYFEDINIIEKAKEYLSKEKKQDDVLLDELAKTINENTHLKEKLSSKLEEVNKLKNTYDENIKKFVEEKKILKDKYLSDLNDYIEEIKNKAIDKLDSIKEKKDIQIIEDIEELKEDSLTQEKEIVEYEVGDRVKVEGMSQVGSINELNGEDVVVVIGNLSINTKIDKLEFVSKPIKTVEIKQRKTKSLSPRELNIVGYRVEEALDLIDDFIDNAIGSKRTSIKIVHGFGTGALKKAVREKLRKNKFVREYHDGDYYDGGGGVTIVEFK